MRRVLWAAAIAAAMIQAAPTTGNAEHADSVRAAGTVKSVSVRRAARGAEVVIGISGDIEVNDFALSAPHRIVIDLKGATLSMLPRLYDGIVRAGITNIRVAQNPGAVRVVLDVDKRREYDVAQSENDVRIALETADAFEPWSTSPSSVRSESDVPAREAAAPMTSIRPTVTPVRAETFIVPEPQQQASRITVSFTDTELRDVLAVFAERSGRSIITGVPSVKITAEIIDQPWQTALQSILQAYGLEAVIDPRSGIITVVQASTLRAQTLNEPVESYKLILNYAKADVLAPTVQALLSTDCGVPVSQQSGLASQASAPPAGGAAAGGAASPPGAVGAGGAAGAAAAIQNASTPPAPAQPTPQVNVGTCPPRGRVVPEVSTNSLVIYETKSHLDSLVTYARSFDIRPQQVNIRAQLISINNTQTNQLGISYDLGTPSTFYNTVAPRVTQGGTAREFQVTLGGDAFAGVANATRSYKDNSSINMLYNTTIGNFSLTSFIDALSEEQLTNITAVPSVNTVDKKLASLFVGNHEAYLITPPTAAGAIQATAAAIAAIDVGVKLDVTPSISANRVIRLTIVAEQSSLLSKGPEGPSTTRRLYSGEIIVRDGETAVISGLTQERAARNRRGIPLLMNLPLIGRLFSENDSLIIKDDLLILITPHILDDQIPGMGGRN